MSDTINDFLPSSYYPPPATSDGGTPATPREMYEISGDFSMPETYGGVVETQPNSTVTLPPYTTFQKGCEYNIKNCSGGLITIQAAQGESIRYLDNLINSLLVPNGNSFSFIRNSSNTPVWIIQ